MVKKALFFAVALAVVFFLGTRRAEATPCTVSHTFITGEVLTAATLNANPVAIVACVNAIDNSNVGVNGFFASQIIPLTVGEATFGGSQSYTFSNGLTVNGASITASVGVINSSLTASHCVGLDASKNEKDNTNCVQSITGTANQVIASASTGAVTLSLPQSIGTGSAVAFASMSLTCGGVGYEFGGHAFMSTDGSCNNLLISPVSTGQAVYIQNSGNSANNAHFPDAGGLIIDRGDFTVSAGRVQAASDGSHDGYVAPGFTGGNTSVANTFHHVITSIAITMNGNCATYTLCTVTETPVALTGASVFASSTSFGCSYGNAGAGVIPYVSSASTSSSIAISLFNASGSQINTTTVVTVPFDCAGT